MVLPRARRRRRRRRPSPTALTLPGLPRAAAAAAACAHAGWAKDDAANTLVLAEGADLGALRTALESLDAAQAPGGVLTL